MCSGPGGLPLILESELETQKIVDTATDAAERAAERQKALGADQLAVVAGAVHRAAGALQQDMPAVASYVDEAAAQIERAAGRLRERGVPSLLREVSDFGRRRPVALLAGSVLAGLAVARFLKSSGNSRPTGPMRGPNA